MLHKKTTKRITKISLILIVVSHLPEISLEHSFITIQYTSLTIFFVLPFIGKFKEQASSNAAWLPVLNSKVPEPRPGTCVSDTQTLPDAVLNFVRKNPLMDKAVDHEFSNPVFYKRDIFLTKLIVDK